MDKFVDTLNGFVRNRIVGGHSFLMTWYPNFQLYILYSVKFGIKILTRCSLCQDTISTLSIYVGQSKITESWLISFYWVGTFD